MAKSANSRNGVPIRLTEERWSHIVEEHAELTELGDKVLEAVAGCERIVAGSDGELLAIKMLDHRTALIVVYRETAANDGFVITAFLTSRLASLDRRTQVWPIHPPKQ